MKKRSLALAAGCMAGFVCNAQLPTISGLSADIANPSTSITITGTNFNTTPANNVVFFGAAQATVTAAGATSLTATVPLGATYDVVSVMNTASGLAGYSQYPFLPTYDNSEYIADLVNFSTKTDFTAGTAPYHIAAGDFDGDGKPDLVVANATDSTISVFRNTASSGSITSGSFATKVDFATGGSPRGVAIGDLDGDGKLDIAVTNSTSNTVSVFRNTCSVGSITTGSFAAGVEFVTGTQPNDLAIGDLDGDGKPELAVANQSGGVSVYRNTSTSGALDSSSFATKVTFGASSHPFGVAIGDLDGDGKPDLAVTNTNSNTVSLLRNTSTSGSITTGSFAARIDLSTGGGTPLTVVLADLDGDGKLEIITASLFGATMGIYRNIADSGSITTGSFETKVAFTTVASPRQVRVGDMDGDGKPDLVVANSGGSISVFRNIASSGSFSTGSLDTRVDFSAGSTPYGLAVCDLDGDGKPDVATSNSASASFSVLRNTPSLFPPTVSSVSPVLAYPGASVTITGTKFNTTPANNIVFFGATQATVTAASATSLTATVPVSATYKQVSVLNTELELAGFSPGSFLPTYDNTAYATGFINCDTSVSFATGSHPVGLALGDLDGDGKPEIVVPNESGNSVSVFQNISGSGSITSGSFATNVDFAAGSSPREVCIADMDGDGLPDMVVAMGNSNQVSVYRNTGASGGISAATFDTRVSFTTAVSPWAVAVGDIDGDGKPDIAVTSGSGSTVSVLRNKSTPGNISTSSFASKVDFSAGSSLFGVAIADLDGDEKPELIVSAYGSSNVSVFPNTATAGAISSSSFGTRVDFATGTYPRGVAIGDLDGDGKPEIIAPNGASNNVSVLRNTSTSGSITTGSFDAAVNFTTATEPRCVAIGDLDGDGKPDIAAGDFSAGKVSVLRNTSTSGSITSGSFASKVDFTVGGGPRRVCIGDLDGDGIPDLVTSNYNSNTTVVLRNNPAYSIYGTATVCVGNTTTLADSTSGGTWSSSTTGVATVGSSTGLVTGVAEGTATISYNLGGGALTQVVTVTAATDAGSITGTASLCVGGTRNLSATVAGGTWSSAATAIATVDASGVVTGVASGTAVISYSVNGACGVAAATTVVTINTSPASISGPALIAPGATATLSNTVSGGTWASSDTAIAPVSAAGVVSGHTVGTATISYTLSSGCYAVKSVTVGLAPVTGTTSFCMGTAGVMSCASAPGTGWTSSNTAVATIGYYSGVVTPVSAGTATITFTAYSGATTTTVITVNPLPGAISGTLSVCPGSTTTLSSSSSGGTWSTSAPFVAVGSASGVVTGVAAGTAIVTYSLGTGCKVVSVVTVSSSSAALTGSAYLCAGGSTTLSTTASGGAWSSSAAGVASVSGGVVTGVGAGTSTISYTTSSGCYSTKVVTVAASAAAITGAALVCDGSSSTLSNAVTGGTWSSSNTAVASVNVSSGMVTGLSNGTSDITYTVGGCNTTTQVTVTATLPLITGLSGACVGGTTALGNATAGGTWSSSDATVGTVDASTGVVTGIATGSVTITYALSAGCYRTRTLTVSSGPADAITGTTSICEGNTTVLSAGTGASWSSSNTGVATVGLTSGVVTGVSAGSATITFTALTGCNSTSTVTVNALPSAITGTFSVCKAATTTLSSATSGGVWTSSATSKATVDASTGVVTGVNLGTATIIYTAAGCSTTQAVTVDAPPTLPAIVGVGYIHLIGGSNTLTGTGAVAGTWTSGNPAIISVVAGPSSTTTATGVSYGSAWITYTVSNGCGSLFRRRSFSVVPFRPGPAVTTAETETTLRIYPSPTEGAFTVEAPSAGQFTVYSVDGCKVIEAVITNEKTVLSLPGGLAAGVYICRFIDADGSQSRATIVYHR